MNWKLASDKELIAIITYDEMARTSDIVEAKAELDRRCKKLPKVRVQYKIRESYSK